ncbi:MAG TPA: glucose-6-phosphate dehydrogenase [Candidatus Dormibacteraeota bacterium]|nr:glucose-6-phosphate dehydrogenase [Candidatus Dormibacteraeota bacterium]
MAPSRLRVPPDQDLLVFGATGDLAQRKLLPALYELSVQGLLPRDCEILGTATKELGDHGFREIAREAVKQFSRTGFQQDGFAKFARRLRYITTTHDQVGTGEKLAKALKRPRRLIYLAVPPSAFVTILQELKGAGLAKGSSVIIEKPFGHDLKSAVELNVALHKTVPEDRIFRIDHYLGKETVQNLLVFRFGNTLIERIWNRDVVEQVQLTVAEDLGIESRGRLYEETGAIRDIFQNHLLQLLALTCMSPPSSFDPAALQDEKVKVLHSIRPVEPSEVVRGQYTRGSVNGSLMPGYREVDGVSPDSTTETYVAMRLAVDTWDWAGVPFYLRCGKALSTRRTEIMLFCRDVPLHLFAGTGIEHLTPNRVTIRIQPEEGISFSFMAKQPGATVVEQPVRMDFSYGKSFKTAPAEAYERLLHDALLGDHTLFIRQDETEAAWTALQPVLELMPRISFYPAGSEGPESANSLLLSGAWHDLSHHADPEDPKD